jgi:PE-PPE domain
VSSWRGFVCSAAVIRHKWLVYMGAVGATLGVASALNSAAASADASDPLAGSDTAIIVGGTGQPMPSTEFAQAAEDLYLHPLGFDDGATGSTVCDMIGTDPCAAPLQVLTTPELFQQGPGSDADADDVTLAVENEFNANPNAFSADHPLTVFGYSQSATAESLAMTQINDYSLAHGDSIPLDDLHFVFIGDPSNPVTGEWLTLQPILDSMLGTTTTNDLINLFQFSSVLGVATPDDLYPTTIYSFDPDPIANFPQAVQSDGVTGALLNVFGSHVEYLGLTPEQIADATTSTDGNLQFVNISDSGVNNADAFLTALLEHGVADSSPLQALFQSLELWFFNTY